MRTKFVIIFFSVFMAFSVVAQNADKIPESESISSLSVGLTVLNQYPIGEYFEFQKAHRKVHLFFCNLILSFLFPSFLCQNIGLFFLFFYPCF